MTDNRCVSACAAADLCVAEGHVLTQLVDILLTRLVQLRLQADVLRLQRFREELVDSQKTCRENTETFNPCSQKEETQTV